MRIVVIASIAVPLVLLLMMAGAYVYGMLFPHEVLSRKANPFPTYTDVEVSETAVLIACRNGEATIAATVRGALSNGIPVYVVSDDSSDTTVDVATAAGAEVLALSVNVGKPAALFAAYEHFRLGQRFQAIAILDDDTVIGADFMTHATAKMTAHTAIVVGRNVTFWPHEKRWNVWLARRAFSYWNYQLVIRRIQSLFNVMNCISGSNSVYRTELLDAVLGDKVPYIVDDTYWVLETHRRQLGKVVYAPKAEALLQDPTTFSEWYKQNLRWLWGTFQGIIGHRIGTRRTRFDVAYVALILHWIGYMATGPISLWFIFSSIGGVRWVVGLLVGQAVWVTCAAIRLGKPRLLLFVPLIALTDLLYRVLMAHALIKALRQPKVDKCVWASPARMSLQPGK